MILANLAARTLKLADVAAAANRTGKDVAIVAVATNVNEDTIVGAFQDGARGWLCVIAPNTCRRWSARIRSLNMRRSVRRLETSLRETERRCDALLDSSRDPIAYVHEGMHVRANKAYLEIFGFEDFEEIQGMSILDMIAPDDADDFKSLLKKLSKGEKPPQKLNLKAQRGDGTTFDATMEFAEASYEGEPCQQIIFRQQTVSVELAKELDVLRSKDLVTDLYNRTYCLAELDRAVGEATKGRNDQALLLLEPDNFRQLLDTVGLGNADLLLGDMANLMRRHIKESDIAGRFGEHTFGVILAGRTHDEVRHLAESLRKAFEERIFEVGKQSLNVNVSIGGTLIGEKNANAMSAINQASASLRTAQAEGGNRINVFDPNAKDKADEEKNRALAQAGQGSVGRATASCCSISPSSVCTAPRASSTKSCCACKARKAKSHRISSCLLPNNTA